MSILIRWTMMVYREGSVEVSERQLDVMVAQGVDVRDEYAVADFYRKHLGQDVDGVWFDSLHDIADNWDSADDRLNEIEDWSPEGEAPDRFWPEEDAG